MASIDPLVYNKELRESVIECMSKIDELITTVNGIDITDLNSKVTALQTDVDKIKVTLYTPITNS